MELRRSVLRAVPAACAAGAFALLGKSGAAALLVALSFVVLALGLLAPGAARRVDRLLERAGIAAATGVATALSWLSFSLGVLPAWALGRVTRRAPLQNPWISPRSAWTIPPSTSARNSADIPQDPNRPGARDLLPAPRSASGRLLGTAVAVAVFALGVSMVLSGGTGGWPTAPFIDRGTNGGAEVAQDDQPGVQPVRPRQARDIAATEFDGLVVDEYAHEDEPWAAAALGEIQQLPYSPDFFLGHRLGDFEGRYVNTLDGRRVSYTPEDPELTVWFFGGSTMFGIGQRDDHTLPSVVTRLAEADGIRIRALNFGVSGYVNWQSLEQFEQALTSDELEPPDLAVFYEGVNERGLGTERVELGDVRPGTISRLTISDDERDEVRDALDNTGRLDPGDERTELEIQLAADQYRRGAELIGHLGASFDVPVVHVWQPSPFAKKPSPADDELWRRLDYSPEFLPESTRWYTQVRLRSRVDVIDLTTSLDEIDRPVYFDGGHTNELGARIVGAAMYERLRPQLQDLSG